jgi:hypothetical protein
MVRRGVIVAGVAALVCAATKQVESVARAAAHAL